MMLKGGGAFMSEQSGTQKIKKALILVCLVVFFLQALITILSEAKHDYGIVLKFSGLSDDGKRALLLGDLYEFIRWCGRTIPEEANILLLTDDTGSDGLYLSYHLFPRKLFFDSFDPIRQTPPDMHQLDSEWLTLKKIQWIIYRFTKQGDCNKIVQIEEGRIIQEIPYHLF